MSDILRKHKRTHSMADQGFPRGDPNLLFGIIVAQNCMEMEKLDPRMEWGVGG